MTSCAPSLIPDEARARAEAFRVPRAEAPERVVVALSGGVDSAVAAWLLHEMGHEVIGVSLRLAPDPGEGEIVRQGRCCSADDLTDARQLCDRLGVPFHAVDARDRFKDAVYDPFVDAYRRGVTPIPCLACNHAVKFGDLMTTARQLGAKLATGHYARRVERGGHPAIARPVDRSRDQTYWLYGTEPDAVADLLLPLGDLDKPLVRGLADRAGIAVSAKPDSQEICFVPDGDHAAVVERAAGSPGEGDLVLLGKGRLRRHEGVHRFTVGQRRGLGVAAGERLYVVDVDGESGTVTVGPRDALGCTRLRAEDLRPLVPVEAWPERVTVQVRARHRGAPARVHVDESAGGGGAFEVTFDEPVDAVAPGQAAVVYDGDVLLGGGLIAARLDGAMPREVSISGLGDAGLGRPAEESR